MGDKEETGAQVPVRDRGAWPVRELAPEVDGTDMRFRLEDRTVNVVRVKVPAWLSLRLSQPPADTSYGTPVARDYMVVLDLDSDSDVRADLDGNLKDCCGNPTSVVGRRGTPTSYRVTEISRKSNRFLVSGANDPALEAAREIERALDDILAEYGSGTFEGGLFVPCDDGLYYRVSAEKDETSAVRLAVEQEGRVK